jgi:hypothetical protein
MRISGKVKTSNIHHDPSTAEFGKAEASLTGAPELDKALLIVNGDLTKGNSDPDWFDITNLHDSAYGGDESEEIVESLFQDAK